MSDFKSNEYANLLGGRQFEPKEENPMIGWRGASRYYDPKYREAYALECKALKRGNVIFADEFAQVFDGFSIGSNDLTQLTLGLDRDSALVAHLFDERNPAVRRMVTIAIKTAKKYGRKIGICGQAPSDYPEFARFLVELGIDSISLNPDSVLKTTLDIGNMESSTTIVDEMMAMAQG